MLVKDKALLESLTRKYGKNYILNEISRETIISARDKADKLGRLNQRDYFANGLARKEEKMAKDIIDNLSLELMWDDGCNQFYFDKKYPIIVGYIDNIYFYVDILEDYDFLEKFESIIIEKVAKILNHTIIEDCGVNIIRKNQHFDNYFESILFTKSEAREWAKFMKDINKKLGFEYIVNIDWHNYCEL